MCAKKVKNRSNGCKYRKDFPRPQAPLSPQFIQLIASRAIPESRYSLENLFSSFFSLLGCVQRWVDGVSREIHSKDFWEVDLVTRDKEFLSWSSC